MSDIRKKKQVPFLRRGVGFGEGNIISIWKPKKFVTSKGYESITKFIITIQLYALLLFESRIMATKNCHDNYHVYIQTTIIVVIIECNIVSFATIDHTILDIYSFARF